MVLYILMLAIFAILCGVALFDIIYYLPQIYKLLKEAKCQKNHRKHGK